MDFAGPLNERKTEATEHRYFLPWIGRDYIAHPLFPCRIAVVGESHYTADATEQLSREFTIQVTEEYAAGIWTHKFWSNISAALAGQPVSQVDRRQLWDNIAFFNYVDEVMRASRIAPSRQGWEKGKAHWYGTINALQPDLAIILGRRLWNEVPDGERVELLEIGDGEFPVHRYNLHGGKCMYATWIRHPSAAFRWEKWHSRIAKAIAYIQAQQVKCNAT